MRHCLGLFFLAFIILFPVTIQAETAKLTQDYLPNAQRVGDGRASWLFWDLYEAFLYAPDGKYQKGQPLALSLHYLLDLEGEKIADQSTSEIRRLGYSNEEKIAQWDHAMKEIFPDVKKGDSLTGILTASGKTIFFKGQEKIGTIADPEFGLYFFDIWLNEQTRLPRLRAALLRNQ